jgi:hypothetical protein
MTDRSDHPALSNDEAANRYRLMQAEEMLTMAGYVPDQDGEWHRDVARQKGATDDEDT